MSINYKVIPSPAYVLEEERLVKNLELLNSVQQQAGVQIILALKGFAMWKVFPLIRKYLTGATASSLHEARLIFEEMGTRAHTYSPAYFPNDFDALLNYSSHITFNSLSEFNRYETVVKNAALPVSLGLRVNPEYSDVTTDLYNPASPNSRLGVLAAQLPTQLPDSIEGLHLHTLCESTAEATINLIQQFEEKFSPYFHQLKWINLGGGHLMTRKGYELDVLIQGLKSFKAKFPHLEVILEPGSAIAWETGELVATVLDIVENGGIKTAILDVSFTAHMPDTLEMPYRPKIMGATDPVDGKPTYRLGGVSCLAGDYMEAYSFDEPLAIGQKVIFGDMIHYTMVKTTTFNGVQHPDIGIWKRSGEYELIRHFTFEDFKNRLS